MTKVTEVAAAVFQRPDGRFLLAQRPEGKPYPGYWEFPGGKLEAGESAFDCLRRELKEELDVEVLAADPWITRVHAYTHATVRLHFFRVTGWRGEFRGLENQAHSWQRIDALDVGPMLPANTPVFRALSLPVEYAVSDAEDRGIPAFLSALDATLARGVRLVQLREKSFDAAHFAMLASEVVARAHAAGARVLLNADPSVARQCGADGVQVPAAALLRLEARPDVALAGASCHTREEIARAGELGFDFAVAGAVRNTPSHPGHAPLGWDAFRALVRDAPLPVFAIGGLERGDLAQAQACGAHGVALRRGAWRA